MGDEVGINYFFSFISSNIFVRGEEKQLHLKSYFENKCLAK